MLNNHFSPQIKRLTVLGISLFFVSLSQAAENSTSYQLGVSYEIPTAGKLNIDEDPLIGLEGKYFLSHNGPHHLFLSGGFKTDTDKSGFATDLIYADLGAQYDFTDSTQHRWYLEYSFGATYMREEYTIDLLDRVITESFSEFGYKASFGIGYEFHQSFNTKLFLSQFGGESDSRTIGLSFSFAF